MSTFPCPQCHADLPEFQKKAGFCPYCDAKWDGATADLAGEDITLTMHDDAEGDTPTHPDAGGQTIDLGPPEVSAPQDGNQTVDLPDASQVGDEFLESTEKDIAHTIDLGDADTESGFTLDPSVTGEADSDDEAGTQDDLAGTQATIDLPPGGTAPTMPTLDLGDAVSGDEDYGQTVDIDDPNRPQSDEDLHVTFGSQPLSPKQVQKYWGTGEGTPMQTMRTATVSKAKELGVDLRRRVLSSEEEGSDYAIINQIGRGGMGVVYAAQQKALRRRVAVKTLKRDIGQREGDRVKFLSEAVITGHLDHPNIVPIHELGQTEDGTLFYSMKCVTGTEWHKVIRNKSEVENLEILLKVADAVAFAHSRNVIHRDLKPENVMLGEFGEVLVMDWGLAVDLNRKEEFTMGGTPAYMAPEMAKGPLERIGKCSDIYLLGAMLYEIVTGFPPHAASTVTECLVAAAQNVIVRSDTTNRLKNIALKAMATSPKLRFNSVAMFQDEIRKYQSTAQSIELANNAQKDLESAKESGNYELFSRALFGFEDALKLWSENDVAVNGIREARQEYARCALNQSDYDLGLQLVSPEDPDDEPIHAELVEAKARAERVTRNAKVARWVAVGSLLFALIGASVGMFVINEQKQVAIALRSQAEESAKEARAAEQVARDAEQDARNAEQAATAAKADAVKQKESAVANLNKANALAEQLRIEQDNLKSANSELTKNAKVIAEQKQNLEVALEDVQQQKKLAEFRGMFSAVGLAQTKIESNDIAAAIALLEKVPPEYRGWEWHHLAYLCHPDVPQVGFQQVPTAVSISNDGKWTAIGTDGQGVSIYPTQTATKGAKPTQLVLPACRVNVLRFSPHAEQLWIGTDLPQDPLWVWDGKGEPVSVKLPNLERSFSYAEVRSIAFGPSSSNDTYVVAGGFLYRVNRNDGEAGIILSTVAMYDVDVSPDGSELLQTQKHEGRYLACRRETGSRLETIAELTTDDPATHCQYLSEKMVVLGLADGSLVLWDGSPTGSETKIPLPSQINRLRYDVGRKQLAAALLDGSIMMWEFESASGTLSPYKTLRGHRAAALDCAFDPVAPELVSVSDDRTSRFWNTQTYEDQLTVELPSDALWASFSEDGSSFVTGDATGEAEVWNTVGGNGQARLKLHVGDVNRQNPTEPFMAIASDQGKYIVMADPSAGIDVWDVAQQQIAWHQDTHADSRRIVEIPGTEQFIYIDTEQAENGKQTTVLRSASVTGEPGFRVTSKIDPSQFTSLAVSPDAKYLAILTPVWIQVHKMPTASDAQLADEPLWQMNSAGVRQIGFSAEGNLLVGNPVTAARGALNVIDFQNDRRLFGFPDQEQGLPFLLFSLSPDRTHAAVVYHNLDSDTGRGPSEVCLYDLSTRKRVAQVHCDSRVTSPSVSSDNQTVYFVMAVPDDEPNMAYIGRWNIGKKGFDVWTHALAGRRGSEQGRRHIVRVNSIPGDPGKIQVSYYNRDIELWDAQTGQSMTRLAMSRPVIYTEYFANNQRIVTVHQDGLVRTWDAQSGKLERVYDVGYQTLQAAALSGDMIAVGGTAEQVTLIDLSQGKVHPAWNPQQGEIDSLTWAGQPQKEQLLVGASNRKRQQGAGDRFVGTLRFYEPASGKPLSEPFASHDGRYTSLAISRQGERLAATSTDKMVRLWADVPMDQLSNTKPQELTGHSSSVTAAAFSGDGQRLISGTSDGALTVWFVERIDVTGEGEGQAPQSTLIVQEFVPLKGHRKAISSIVFSPDKRTLLTSAHDRRAILWFSSDLKPADGNLVSTPGALASPK